MISLHNGPVGIKRHRLLLINDSHGRIIIANGSTPSKKGHYQYIPNPDCLYLRLYVSEVLKNISRLQKEDERENDRLFDREMKALSEIERVFFNYDHSKIIR